MTSSEYNNLCKTFYSVFSEVFAMSNEIHIGRIKLKILEDHVIKETFDNYLPDIVASKSNLCITSSMSRITHFVEVRLWRCDGNNYQEISALHPAIPGYPHPHPSSPGASTNRSTGS